MAEQKRAPQLEPSRFKLAEYERQDWIVNAGEGVVPDDLTDPAYWALTAAKMKPYDHIEVRADDGTWVANLLVMGCDRTWARTHIIAVHQLTSADVSLTDAVIKHDVIWRGPQHKWCVKRLADNEVIKGDLATKDEAATWLKDYEKTIAA